MKDPDTQDSTLHLPRILCLHGGGTNARIFRMQCRSLIRHLDSEYRFVFAEAPFSSLAGPDVLSVYSSYGPFKRWLRWLPEHPQLRPEEIVRQIDQSLEDAMSQDDACGATGEFAALLGFSQGAKVAASLLYRQQVREELFGKRPGSLEFRFAVLMAGRSPLISLDTGLKLSPPLPDASQITDFRYLHDQGQAIRGEGHLLRLPTIHVHGLRDVGIDLHRELYDLFCDPKSRRLVEWDGDHRLPLKSSDVSLVLEQIHEVAKDTGIY